MLDGAQPLPLSLSLGHQLHVDVADVHGARGALAERRVRVARFRLCADDARGFFGLETRVLEIRPRRRLDLQNELGAIVDWEERRTDGTYGRNDLRQHHEHRDPCDHRAPTQSTTARKTVA